LKSPGFAPAILFWGAAIPLLHFTIAGRDPAILFAATKKDARVEPAQGETWIPGVRAAQARPNEPNHLRRA
jgi:hypothetical protein